MPTEKKITVETLAKALKRAKDYPDVVGFCVAPVHSAAGGRPRWHYLSPDRSEWMAMELEAAELPSIKADVKTLPKLPPSPIGQWLVAFVDEDGDFLKPYLVIDPQTGAREGADEEPDRADKAGAPLDMHRFLLTLIDRKDHHACEVLREAAAAIRNARLELDSLTAVRRTEVENLIKRLSEAEETTRAVVSTNKELSDSLAELRADGQLHQTVREIFRDHPEMLVGGIKELLGGLMDKLKS